MRRKRVRTACCKAELALSLPMSVRGRSRVRRTATVTLCATVAALAMMLGGSRQTSAGSITFDFQFESVFSAPGGTGTFTIDSDPGLGTFTLASLGSFTMNFSVDGIVFTDADIASDPTLSEVSIFATGPGQEGLYFTDTGSGGGGPFGGSLDLINDSFFIPVALSFSPSYAGPGEYIILTPFGLYDLGLYTALSVPEPASIVQLGLGASCLAIVALRQARRRTAA
jgi:hypothetical protein